jgi:hypothetical protein
MAITARQPKLLFSIGSLQRFCVYGIYGANTSDTVQVSSEFQNVLAVNTLWVPSTGPSVTAVCTVATNTLITLSPASITVDDGFLVVMGAGVQQ